MECGRSGNGMLVYLADLVKKVNHIFLVKKLSIFVSVTNLNKSDIFIR